MDDREFRSRLDSITGNGSAEDWESQIIALQRERPHSIRRRAGQIDRLANCFAWALGLDQWAPYRSAVAKHRSNVLVNGMFVAKLIEVGTLVEDSSALLVIYFDDEGPQHAALREGTRFVSKWGSGPVFEHAEFELPGVNGSQTRPYRIANRAALEEAFIALAGG